MADEYSKRRITENCLSQRIHLDKLTTPKGAALETHYNNLLRDLAKEKNILGQIFTKSQNKIQDPAKLSRLIDLIDKEQWNTMAADVKGKSTKDCWRKNAEDTKKRSRTVLYAACTH